MIRTLVLLAAVYLALVAQEFIPPASFFDGARIILVPSLFCYGALWLPFPGMLVFALYTGLLSDLAFLHIVGDRVEIGLGWTMLFYVLAGTALHSFRPLFLAGRWEIHCLASTAVTALLLLSQFLMVCLRRETFSFDKTILWQILGPALVAFFLAPILYFIFRFLPRGFAEGPPSKKRLTS